MAENNAAVEQIKAKAQQVGFDAVRVTTPDPPEHGDAMAAWLEAEMHGQMHYLPHRAALRAGSLDNENLLAETRSVIMLAMSYDFEGFGVRGSGERAGASPALSPEPRTPNSCLGTVARYARGRDYHSIFWEKLKILSKWMEETYPGTRTRGFADSGPIRERELAARAGIGWQGKHTNLISLDLGNWFFLGALLTTLPLPPDAAVADHCGTCTRCLAACPTGALIAPLTLDARRCISYLTIELKEAIPLELRPLMGDRIFGCDDCLAACPWNERAASGREMRLAARDADAAHPDLLEWLTLLADETAFRAKFAGTPLLRPGRAGLRRNVCVALGNVGDAGAIPALSEAAQNDESPLVREHAVWAITEIKNRHEITSASA